MICPFFVVWNDVKLRVFTLYGSPCELGSANGVLKIVITKWPACKIYTNRGLLYEGIGGDGRCFIKNCAVTESKIVSIAPMKLSHRKLTASR